MSGSANPLKGESRKPFRWLLAGGAGLLAGFVLLSQCSQEPKPVHNTTVEFVTPYAGLHFDGRYYDSIGMSPQSEGTKRQRAIFDQLRRMEMTKPYRNKQGQIVPLPKMPNDSIYTRIGDGPLMGFANKEEELADIHRKIDSLKVLENIPLTPH